MGWASDQFWKDLAKSGIYPNVASGSSKSAEKQCGTRSQEGRLYMGNKYIFVGWACGRFDAEQRDGSKEKKPYYNIYVISAVSSWESEDYKAEGLKAEKMKCVSNAVWKDVEPGEEVDLYFDDKQRVVMMASTGRRLPLDLQD